MSVTVLVWRAEKEVYKYTVLEVLVQYLHTYLNISKYKYWYCKYWILIFKYVATMYLYFFHTSYKEMREGSYRSGSLSPARLTHLSGTLNLWGKGTVPDRLHHWIIYFMTCWAWGKAGRSFRFWDSSCAVHMSTYSAGVSTPNWWGACCHYESQINNGPWWVEKEIEHDILLLLFAPPKLFLSPSHRDSRP